MQRYKSFTAFFFTMIFALSALAQSGTAVTKTTETISALPLPGAYNLPAYLPLLRGKRVGVFANNTSVVGDTHLVDTLKACGINIVKIFAPEHGFRGKADAGEKFGDITDAQTGIKVISLYGKKTTPADEDVKDVDILLFDLQDVGVRFYTYINSLQHFIEGAYQTGKPLVLLDRPNPNGWYVDGPVLDTAFRSGVGLQPVPVVYGMTLAEYAMMLIGEQWTKPVVGAADIYVNNKKWGKPARSKNALQLYIITCSFYNHDTRYELPVKPSPNLPTTHAVNLYPSTCFFEGTTLSEGRGTDHPFEIFGHPQLPDTLFAFTPHSTEGAKEPKWKEVTCYGWNVENEPVTSGIELKWLLQAYRIFPDKDHFFRETSSTRPEDQFLNKLAGNADLMQQLKEGKGETEIRASWQPALTRFKAIRKKYLLYKDVSD